MWREMSRIIGEVRPRFAFVENSPMLVTRGLERVLADLTSMGYDSKWGVVSAADVGAPHRRERIWILANTKLYGLPSPQVARGAQETIRKQQARSHNTLNFAGTSGLSTTESDVAHSCGKRLQGSKQFQNDFRKNISGETITHGAITKRNNDGRTSVNWWDFEPNVGRVANGVAARVDRLKAIGNGQVPLCAATAWELLK
jgi:DNA (cytosine-5)-methyltransferase 1